RLLTWLVWLPPTYLAWFRATKCPTAHSSWPRRDATGSGHGRASAAITTRNVLGKIFETTASRAIKTTHIDLHEDEQDSGPQCPWSTRLMSPAIKCACYAVPRALLGTTETLTQALQRSGFLCSRSRGALNLAHRRRKRCCAGEEFYAAVISPTRHRVRL